MFEVDQRQASMKQRYYLELKHHKKRKQTANAKQTDE